MKPILSERINYKISSFSNVKSSSQLSVEFELSDWGYHHESSYTDYVIISAGGSITLKPNSDGVMWMRARTPGKKIKLKCLDDNSTYTSCSTPNTPEWFKPFGDKIFKSDSNGYILSTSVSDGELKLSTVGFSKTGNMQAPNPNKLVKLNITKLGRYDKNATLASGNSAVYNVTNISDDTSLVDPLFDGKSNTGILFNENDFIVLTPEKDCRLYAKTSEMDAWLGCFSLTDCDKETNPLDYTVQFDARDNRYNKDWFLFFFDSPKAESILKAGRTYTIFRGHGVDYIPVTIYELVGEEVERESDDEPEDQPSDTPNQQPESGSGTNQPNAGDGGNGGYDDPIIIPLLFRGCSLIEGSSQGTDKKLAITDGNGSTGINMYVDGYFTFKVTKNCKISAMVDNISQRMTLYEANNVTGNIEDIDVNNNIVEYSVLNIGRNKIELFENKVFEVGKVYAIKNYGPVVNNGDIKLYDLYAEETTTGSDSSSGSQGNSNRPILNNQANVIITRAFLGSPIPSTETRNNVDLLTDRNDSTGLSIGVDGCIEFTPAEDCKLWVKTGVIYQKMYLYDQQGMNFRGTQEVAQSVLTQGGSGWYELFPGFTFKANQPYSIYNYGPSIRYPNDGRWDVYEMFFEDINPSPPSPPPSTPTVPQTGLSPDETKRVNFITLEARPDGSLSLSATSSLTDKDDSTSAYLQPGGYIKLNPQEDAILWLKTSLNLQPLMLKSLDDGSIIIGALPQAQSKSRAANAQWFKPFGDTVLKANSQGYQVIAAANGDTRVEQIFLSRAATGNTGNGPSINNNLLNALNEITIMTPYLKTTWVDGTTIIDAQKMNNIEATLQKHTSKINELITATNLIREILLSLKVSPTDLTALVNDVEALKSHSHINTVGAVN